MELHKYLDQVEDQQSFLEFARALLADKQDENRKEEQNSSSPYDHGWNGWQNNSIEGFLESAIACAEASNFGADFAPSQNPWKRFALFLYGGKIYE